MDSSPSLHIAMLPWFSMKHITPFLQLSNKLAERGHKISFFIPKHTHETLQHLNHHPNLISLIPLSVHNDHNLPNVAETTYSESSVSLFMNPNDLCEKDIEVHLLELKPNIVFFDVAYFVPTPRLTQCLGIKSLVYYVISPLSLAYDISSYPLRVSQRCVNITEHNPMFHTHEPKILAGSGKVEYVKNTICTNSTLTQSFATGLKVNFSDNIYIDYYRKHVLLAGSVIPKAVAIASNLDENWAKWLAKFEAGSVVYCAFDNESTLELSQFQELLLGLELSGMPFLATLKAPKEFECVESAFPQGFLDRVQGRGVVIGHGCVPQKYILEHPSVGCFITHCGAGSLLSEAVVNKCQLVLLPNHGKMVINARVIGNSLKVGVEVEKLKAVKMVCLPKKVVCARL